MQMTRRQTLLATLGAAIAVHDDADAIDVLTASHPAVDAAASRRREWWLHHPTIGDPSWDTFVREPGNPIHSGAPPYEWPVNGYLFRDPPTGRWYCYPSVYPRGYWPPPGANSRILREKPGGGWEDLGFVFNPPQPGYVSSDGTSGVMTDVCVVYDGGRYHLIYGWADKANKRGGLGYAVADTPEGPFRYSQVPLHDDAAQKPLLGVYVRAYASTLLRRRSDWLIIHMMSTPGNGGGTWGLFGMRAAAPEGPYTAPVPLLYPQSDRFHPAIAEFFPAFVHEGVVYAPATSVARNRSFQVVFRAPIEMAHLPEAWSIWQYGSVWHTEPEANEAQGIWGQTFSAQVSPDGTMRAMFPSKTAQDVGTTNMARRPWKAPYRDGFVVSAPNAPAFAVLRAECDDFRLRVRARSSGAWTVCFGCAGPLGPNQNSADSVPHPRMRVERTELQLLRGRWRLVRLASDGHERVLGEGSAKGNGIPGGADVERKGARVNVRVEGCDLFSCDGASSLGRLELVAEAGTILRVEACEVVGALRPGWESWLAMDALAGQACSPGDWHEIGGALFRFGAGFESARLGVRAKWNFDGRGFRLWAPKGPRYGTCSVLVDGRKVATVDLWASSEAASSVVCEHSVSAGRHAVAIVAESAVVPCDTLDVLQPVLHGD